MHRVRIVLERLFHSYTQGRKVDGLLDPLLGHLLEAEVAIAVDRVDRLESTERFADALSFRIDPVVVVVKTARARDRIEGRVRDEPIDLSRDQQFLATVKRRPVHTASLHARFDMPRESILRFVVVVVSIEEQKRQFSHEEILGFLGS